LSTTSSGWISRHRRREALARSLQALAAQPIVSNDERFAVHGEFRRAPDHAPLNVLRNTLAEKTNDFRLAEREPSAAIESYRDGIRVGLNELIRLEPVDPTHDEREPRHWNAAPTRQIDDIAGPAVDRTDAWNRDAGSRPLAAVPMHHVARLVSYERHR